MTNHQREDILRLPITLTGKTAQKWIEIREEHGIGDQDFADLLMHRYEVTSHLFVPVASSTGSSTTFTFNGPIGVSETVSPSSKPVKKRGRPPKQTVVIAPSPTKPLQKKQSTKKTVSKKGSSKMAKVKNEKASSEGESSESDDSGSSSSDSDDSNTGEATSEEYNPSVESQNDSEEEAGGLTEEEADEEKAKREKYERDNGGGMKQYDALAVAKVEGIAMPRLPPRPRAKLQRKYWSSLTKQYHCKLCPFESPNPKLACQHLLQKHRESVGELREYLLGVAAPDSEPDVTLFHVVMAERPPAGPETAEKRVDSDPSGQSSNDAAEKAADINVSIATLEGGFGFTRSEAAQTLANVAESLVTVAQLEESNLHVAQSGFQRTQMAMGQLPSDVAQAQLELMQRQLDAAHGLTHLPGSLPLPMNIAENAFGGGHRQMQEFGLQAPMLMQQHYPVAGIHPQSDVGHHHGAVPHPHQVLDPLGRSDSVIAEAMKSAQNLHQGSPSPVLTSHPHTAVSGPQIVDIQSQNINVQHMGHYPEHMGRHDIHERTGHLSEPPGVVVSSEEIRTDPPIKPEPSPETTPQPQGGEQRGAMVESSVGDGEGEKETCREETDGTHTDQNEEKDHPDGNRTERGENGENNKSGDSKTDEQTEGSEGTLRRSTRSASKRKYAPPSSGAQARRGRGRPKGARTKKAPEAPPEKEDPFDEIKFLQILMKWVKIMVSCPTCEKSLHNLGVITKKGVKISHVCRTTETKSEAEILCHLCGKSFMSGRGFKVHWQEYHGNMQRSVCQFCGKVVKGSYLTQHINRCHTETGVTYQCAMCGKAFKSKSACDKHEVVHRTEKPHKCPYCARGFTQQANMKHHMRQHTGEQPYRCETCAKSFTHNVSLKNHLKRQHGVDLWQMGHTGGGRPKKAKPVESLENKPFVN